jgi:hypothetical protein
MTELEKHFKSADLIASEALGIALEKEKAAHQETKRQFEAYKERVKKIQDIFNSMDLSPATKEETFNWKKAGD